MPKLENQVAIVTGASAGIGYDAALGLAGAKVVVTARRKDRLDELAGKIGGIAVAGDITDPAVRKEVVDACKGRIDILVNNAGFALPGPVEIVTEKEYRRQFEVNFFAALEMMRLVAPFMRYQRSGRIINMSSLSGRVGLPLFGYYAGTKFAIEGVSDSARLELGVWGVKVVLIQPGPIKTELFDISVGYAESQMADEDSPYLPFYRRVKRIESDFRKRATPVAGVTRVVLKACTRKNPKARYTVNRMAKFASFGTRFLPRRMMDALLRIQFRVPRPEHVK